MTTNRQDLARSSDNEIDNDFHGWREASPIGLRHRDALVVRPDYAEMVRLDENRDFACETGHLFTFSL